MSITQTETQKYEDLHATIGENYAKFSPAEKYLPAFLQIVGEDRGTVLDAGCSSGKGGLWLAERGFDVWLTDLTADALVPDAHKLPFFHSCLWQNIPLQPLIGPEKYALWDYVVCCDVLEHVPTQFTMLAVVRMLDVVEKGLFLTVSLVPDNFGAWIGQPLHQTVAPYLWWRDSLKELFTVMDARDLGDAALFYIQP